MMTTEWKSQALPVSNQLLSNLMPQQRSIKHDHLFLINDPVGNIPWKNDVGLGFYASDMRYLSCFEIYLNGMQAIPLMSSTEAGDRSILVYTNPDMDSYEPDGKVRPILRETVQLRRITQVNGSLFERLSIRNYNQETFRFQLVFAVAADFRDLFDVRHLDVSDPLQGQPQPAQKFRDRLILSYIDGMGERCETRIVFKDFEPKWLQSQDERLIFAIDTELAPLERKVFNLEIQAVLPCSDKLPADEPSCGDLDEADRMSQMGRHVWEEMIASIRTDHQDFNEMLERSSADIHMLMTHTTCGKDDTPTDYIAAGIPWYVALFGRDSLITARDCLILNPDIARAVLRILAHYQGDEVNEWRDEEPGKILHELRLGELARMHKIPHTPYYGTVDATPLWLMLFYDYYLWTKDRETIEALWPNALAALNWIDAKLAQTPHGYLSYEKKSQKGLGNQNWKDSNDSAMHADGSLAEAPLAMAEVQSYVYQAKCNLTKLAVLMGDQPLADRLAQETAAFKEKFNSDFWCETLDCYAMGLDKDGRQLQVVSTNPGHCLESGLLDADKAQRLANRLLKSDMFNGWGIRTLSASEVRYNPMSYHNGSVWPHDNALVIRGLAAIGRPELASKVITGLFEAGRLIQYKRMPELFCGFDRSETLSEPPVRYPSACSPQAWAASSVYAFVQSLLNFQPDFDQHALIVNSPYLPVWLNELTLTSVRVGPSIVDLRFWRDEARQVKVQATTRRGPTLALRCDPGSGSDRESNCAAVLAHGF